MFAGVLAILNRIVVAGHSLISAHAFTPVIGSFNIQDYFRFNTQPDPFFLNNLRQYSPVLVLRTKYLLFVYS
jgi:hypothetical protein